ncbi:MAG TPA: hypothetical protein VFU81_10410 [Thermomicrobiales bacterium]|nr:hypothetical protein [Thermomicrobiales bacterium]
MDDERDDQSEYVPTAGDGERAVREDGLARSGGSFDPTPYMRQLRGRGGSSDYLDVKWRLLWLRREHPDAEIVTELVRFEPTLAIFKATVTLPTGGSASGYGSETATDFGDFIEKAETKAIGRALNALGYGAQFTEPGDDEPASAPRRETAPRAVPEPAPVAARPRSAVAAAPAAERRADPIEIGDARARAAASTASADVAAATSEPDLSAYSWSAFWPWARGLGLRDKRAVEQTIGRSMDRLSPAEVRELIVQARGES